MTSLVDPQAAAWARRTPRAWFWPGFVIALIATQLSVCAVTFYLAVSDPTQAVEPDYYASAIKWNDHAAQQRESGELGWTVELDVSSLENGPDERTLTCIIRDRDGAPVRDLTIELTAFAHARSTARQSHPLKPDPFGAYSATIHVQRSGLWEFRAAVRRGTISFTATQLLEVAPPTGRRS